MFPMTLAYALTAHKCQGETFEGGVIVDFADGYFDCGSFYVAISRVKTSDKLFLKSFDISYIKTKKGLEEKIETMRKDYPYIFKKTYLDEHIFKLDKNDIKVGYLNIHGLMDSLHAEYINEDKNLINFDILCLSETHLTEKTKDNDIRYVLSNWEIMQREDCPDKCPHMGLLVIYPKGKSELLAQNSVQMHHSDIVHSSKLNHTQKILAQLLHIRIKQRLLTFIYIREKPNRSDSVSISEKIDISSYVLGDLNLSPSREDDTANLAILCGNDRVLHLNDVTTIGINIKQLDHILVRKTIKHLALTDTYYNFISDHKTISLRISAYANDEPHIKFTEKELPKIKKSRSAEGIITVSDEPINDTELQYPKTSDLYLSCLEGEEWLNDNIINDYLELLGRKYKDVIIFTTFFSEMFFTRNRGYSIASRYCRSRDIFEKRLILIPIAHHSHWFTAVFNFDTKELKMLDPYLRENDLIEINDHMKWLEKLENDFLSLYYYERGYSDWITLKRSVCIPPEIPKQDDGSNCGVFLLEFCRCLCARQSFHFSSKDMPNSRARIKRELQDEKLEPIIFNIDQT